MVLHESSTHFDQFQYVPLISPCNVLAGNENTKINSLDLLNFTIITNPKSLFKQMHTDTKMVDRVCIIHIMQIANTHPAVATSLSRVVYGFTPGVGMGQLAHISQYV
jgi:hypothetical protein